MIELFGLIFGGVSRLGQHWLDLRDKDKERSHEAVMYDKQVALADKRFEHDADLRRMDASAADSAAEWAAMTAALEAQSREAQAAGGWVSAMSASVRPVVTYWLMALYTMAKIFTVILAVQGGVPFLTAATQAYTEMDGALLSSILAFWFVDRSLRNSGK